MHYIVMEFGLSHCQADHSVFHLHIDAGYILLVVYVNSIVIMEELPSWKQFL